MKFTNKKGLTLIEVLIAGAIFVGVFMIIANLFPQGLFVIHKGEQMTKATAIANGIMEEIKSRGYDAINTSNYPEGRQQVQGYPGFERKISITPNVPAPGLKKVELTIYWMERGMERSISLVTLISRRAR